MGISQKVSRLLQSPPVGAGVTSLPPLSAGQTPPLTSHHFKTPERMDRHSWPQIAMATCIPLHEEEGAFAAG